jgi:hypothetical protein
VEAYYRGNPDLYRALLTRPQELASALPRTVATQENSWNLLSLDPFAGLDPVVREMTESRLFAKRATYQLTRMPDLLRLQSELLLLDAASQPGVVQLIRNTTSLSESLDRASRVAEQLPDRVSSEREALVRALEDQQRELLPLIGAADGLSDSLTATVTNTITLVRLLGIGETNRAPEPARTNARPFDVTEYTLAAREMAALARDLEALANSLDAALQSPAFQEATETAEASTRRVLNHAFLVGGGLLLLAFFLALAFKAVVRQWNRADLKRP